MGVFPEHLTTHVIDEELSNRVLSDGVLFYQDENYGMYMLDGIIYVLEPSTFESTLERAVLEAGFATEPLRFALQQCYECLYVRMLSDGMTGFTQKEWDAVHRAKELLGLT